MKWVRVWLSKVGYGRKGLPQILALRAEGSLTGLEKTIMFLVPT